AAQAWRSSPGIRCRHDGPFGVTVGDRYQVPDNKSRNPIFRTNAAKPKLLLPFLAICILKANLPMKESSRK
ncbi:MAG: hypothetical protein ACREUQ_09095, partial [Burkholderiales bacterium]